MRSLAITFSLVILLTIVVTHDSLRLTPVQELSARYHYNLVAWEAANLPAKWLHRLGNAMLPFRQRSAQDLTAVSDYFQMKREADALRAELDRAVASAPGGNPDPERQLEALRHRMDSLRPQVEETLETAISDVLREEHISLGAGRLVFPPVDFALDRLPTLLVISPRQRIELTESVLLTPDLPMQARETLEERIARQEDLSALVEGVGGIAAYPSIINPGDLRGALITASHEWLHQYLFFRPLGLNYGRDADMASLNETTANIFGEELGNLAFARLTGEAPPEATPAAAEPCPQDQFCFDREMRQTRIHVEQLLAEGKVEEAEAYMEQRRQVFMEHGYYIRKLNQAYFAFHGTYADSPASVSPIHEQLRELRRASTSLGAFIRTVAGIASYNEFTTLLQRLRGSGQGQLP